MATVSKWTPFGVALDITATAGIVTRESATQFTVEINASWETYYNGAQTNYGMSASSGGGSVTLNKSGNHASKGSGSFTGTYSISGNAAATKSITVTFKNFNNDNSNSATKTITLSVSVPALASYAVAYSANGGSGAPASQTKWKDQTLTLSSTKPTRTGYSFQGWATSASGGVAYSSGASYTENEAVTLYAVWKANTYTVKYDANGGSGAPANQTKTYGAALTLSSTKPTRTNHNFLGWATSASATTATYAAGASYTTNAAVTLYAVWELAYTKPRITGLSISRCDSAGNVSDEGTYALVKFSWETDQNATSILVAWSSATAASGATPIAASGKSGTVNQIVGGSISADATYTVVLTVMDGGGNSEVRKTLNGTAFAFDALPENKGVAFGKPAELEGYADFKYKQHLRENAEFANDKSIMGIDTDGKSYSALIPVTASGNTSLGHGLYKAGKGNTHIYGNAVQFYTKEGIYLNGNDIYFDNNKIIVGTKADGSIVEAINPINANGNVVIGYGNYEAAAGNTHIYGHDLLFAVSNIANPGTYRPYLRRDMSVDIVIRTTGYVTNAKKDIYFFIPFTRPVVGSPTVTVTSVNGFILRQDDKYTHGSAASTYVTPSSYTASPQLDVGVHIMATFADTTNCLNNAPIGIHWSGTITLT